MFFVQISLGPSSEYVGHSGGTYWSISTPPPILNLSDCFTSAGKGGARLRGDRAHFSLPLQEMKTPKSGPFLRAYYAR
jgi:hypothetical protein